MSLQASEKYELIGSKQTGSAIVELALAYVGADYSVQDLDYQKVLDQASELTELNPLARVPVLKLPNGEVLTESGAILLYLAARFPKAQLLPSDTDFPRFLRMLFLITGEIYPTFTFADVPSEWVSSSNAQKELTDSAIQFRRELWLLLESWLSKNGWAVGPRLTLIDLYLSVMVNWRPRKDWFRENCPKISSIAEHVETEPRLRSVFQRHSTV